MGGLTSERPSILCDNCGSRNVRRSAWARYDPVLGCWVVDELLSICVCRECDDLVAVVKKREVEG